MCKRTQNDAIWGLIALFLTNQIAWNTIDFKMNVINSIIICFLIFILDKKHDKQHDNKPVRCLQKHTSFTG